jgi:hypothetical protein
VPRSDSKTRAPFLPNAHKTSPHTYHPRAHHQRTWAVCARNGARQTVGACGAGARARGTPQGRGGPILPGGAVGAHRGSGKAVLPGEAVSGAGVGGRPPGAEGASCAVCSARHAMCFHTAVAHKKKQSVIPLTPSDEANPAAGVTQGGYHAPQGLVRPAIKAR